MKKLIPHTKKKTLKKLLAFLKKYLISTKIRLLKLIIKSIQYVFEEA